MKKANGDMKAFLQSWEGVRAARPTEVDFSAQCGAGVTAQDFDALFNEWGDLLEAAAVSPKLTNLPQERIQEIILGRCLIDAQNQVNAAKGNGFAWLFQTDFVKKICDINNAMVPLLHKRQRLGKALLQFAQDKLVGDINIVENASPVAERIMEMQSQILSDAEKVSEATNKSLDLQKQIATFADDLGNILGESSTHANSIIEIKKTVDNEAAKVSGAVEDSNKLLEEASAARRRVDESLSVAEKLLEQSRAKLDKALADINRQGLASSFAEKAKALGWERFWWVVAFIISMGWLVWVAFHVIDIGSALSLAATAASGTNLVQGGRTNPSLWLDLIRTLPFVIPGVWLGWLSAKNAGLTGRVQQDYNYKVATALAFQGYRNEIIELGDDILEKRLIDIAITNFGENPIRIYEGKDELGHPIESLKTLFKNDKTYERFLELLKAANPNGRGIGE